jgi:dolichol-phosphate mannosyltransferase
MSLVIPCYNEEDVLPELRRRLKELVSKYSFPIEVVLIDDGSKDNTWPLIDSYAQEDGFVKAVRLARNFGHQTAITCGLDQTRGEVVVILDADLQDPPELIPEGMERRIRRCIRTASQTSGRVRIKEIFRVRVL